MSNKFIIGISLLFFLSMLSTALFCGTDLWKNFILSHLVLRNNTEAFRQFQHPSAPSYVSVYMFNYTNIDDVAAGRHEKYNVKEVGPFVYERNQERINTEWNEDETLLSYNDVNEFKFLPSLSYGHRKNHLINVPNMLMLGAAAMGQEQAYITRVAMSAFFRSVNARPFRQIPVDQFIFGYEDTLYTVAKNVLQKDLPFEKFGILAHLNGTSRDRMTVHTGHTDFDQLGLVHRMNGRSRLGHWSGDCDDMAGIEGFNVPPTVVQRHAPLRLLVRDMCRTMQFRYEADVRILNDSVPAARYVMPTSVLHQPEDEPGNHCYCDQSAGTCPPRGLYNATSCAFGSPVFLSLPHFHDADPEVSSTVTGLTPDANKHLSYLHLHPYMGFAMEGKTRLQINIQVKKSFGITQMEKFRNGAVLPIAWMEFGADADNLPKDIRDLFYNTTVLREGVEQVLKYGLMLTTMVSLLALLLVIRGKFVQHANSLDRNPSGQSRLIV